MQQLNKIKLKSNNHNFNDLYLNLRYINKVKIILPTNSKKRKLETQMMKDTIEKVIYENIKSTKKIKAIFEKFKKK